MTSAHFRTVATDYVRIGVSAIVQSSLHSPPRSQPATPLFSMDADQDTQQRRVLTLVQFCQRGELAIHFRIYYNAVPERFRSSRLGSR
jgi:hypothetical protein